MFCASVDHGPIRQEKSAAKLDSVRCDGFDLFAACPSVC